MAGGIWNYVTFVEQSPFQLLSVPPRFPRKGDGPKYKTFPEITKVDVDRIRGSQVFIEAPAATSAPRKPRNVHLRRRSILDHRVKTDQGPIRVSIWRIF